MAHKPSADTTTAKVPIGDCILENQSVSVLTRGLAALVAEIEVVTREGYH
jgi:hypothetical protein